MTEDEVVDTYIETYWRNRGGEGKSPWSAQEKPIGAGEKHQSDGGSSAYYELPQWARELDDLIVHKNMPWHIANIFKACYRWDQKDGNTALYEARKIEWFAVANLKRVTRETSNV